MGQKTEQEIACGSALSAPPVTAVDQGKAQPITAKLGYDQKSENYGEIPTHFNRQPLREQHV